MKLFFAGLNIFLLSAAVIASDRVSINEFTGRYGFPAGKGKGGVIVYRSAYTELEFKGDSRMMRYNGCLIWLCAGVNAGLGDWQMTRTDAEKVLAPLLRAKDYTVRKRKPRLILIDPGHGGAQAGAKPRRGRHEKDLALDVGLRLRDELARLGIRSAMTRDRDLSLSLPARPRKIGALGADVFVSIHMNSAGNTEANGIETYIVPAAGYPSTSGGKGSTKRVVGNSNDELNSVLAYLIQRDMLRATSAADRGVKRARFDVLAGATCPAVLVECGFLSNTAENGRIQTEKYRQSLAIGLARGIKNYVAIWDQ